MTTYTYEDAAGQTRAIEFRLPGNADRFDFDDDIFKASGHTTASQAMTEVALGGGRSLYTVDFDNARLGLSESRPSVLWRVVDGSQAGVSEFGTLEHTSSGASSSDVTFPLELSATPNFIGDLGDDFSIVVTARQAGEVVPLAAANNVRVSVRESGGTVLLFDSPDFTPLGTDAHNDGAYEVSTSGAGLLADRTYVVTVVATVDGSDVTHTETFTT